MKLTVTEITVHQEDENPIFGNMLTKVKLDDEGGGLFIKLIQHNSDLSSTQEVRLDFHELSNVWEAMEILKKGGRRK